MKNEGTKRWSRRDFVRGLTLAGTVGSGTPTPRRRGPAAGDEIVRFTTVPAACIAPNGRRGSAAR